MGKINTKSHQGTKGCVTHTKKKKNQPAFTENVIKLR